VIAPITTAIRCLPFRSALAAMLNPDAQMKPVFMPVVPRKCSSSLFGERMSVLPARIAGMRRYSRYSGKSSQTARARTARSRAVDNWPSLGRPCGLLKWVEAMPRRAASAFISFRKFASLPPTVSASATAMSLADLTMIIFSALSTLRTVPTLKPIFDGGWLSAFCETLTAEVSLSWPDRSAGR
jgi:hypothetical protein